MAENPTATNREGSSGSAFTRRSTSSNTVAASVKVTPCFFSLAVALVSSHSNSPCSTVATVEKYHAFGSDDAGVRPLRQATLRPLA